MATDTRRVVGNISMSLDGRINGPGGDYDMSWVVPHAVTETAKENMDTMMDGCTTALLGRKNYQGFGSYWPSVALDKEAEPHDRKFAEWLNSVEKVVFSTTINDAPWQNSRISRDPAAAVQELRAQEGRDIYVLSSSSIIRTLLAADELDRLILTVCPELVGAGDNLFRDGLPPSKWSLADSKASSSGSSLLVLDRVR